MSRSKHQTFKTVFGGKSASEVDGMLKEGDEDAMELVEKRRIKARVKKQRREDGCAD